MSRLARHTPDDPEMWDAPPVHLTVHAFPVRRRCWCGQTVTDSSTCGCCCLDHDELPEGTA